MSFADLFVPTMSPGEVIFRAAFVYVVLLVLFRVFARTQMSRHAGFEVAVMFLVGTALRKTIVADDATLTSGVLLRKHGTDDLSRVRAAFVERDGTVTVLKRE